MTATAALEFPIGGGDTEDEILGEARRFIAEHEVEDVTPTQASWSDAVGGWVVWFEAPYAADLEDLLGAMEEALGAGA